VFVEPAEDIRIEEEEREKAADTRMLFVKNMPENISEEDLKKLSSDILVVRRKKPKCRFGYFVFANEKLAEKNYTKLQNVKCGEKVLVVDFYGLKSKNPTKPFLRKKHPIHPMKLYIQNMPSVEGLEDLIRFYPDAISWTVPTNFVNKKYALVTFASTQSARAAFDKSKSLVVGGVPVTVVFSKNIVDEADIGKKGAKKRKNQKKLAKSHKGPKSHIVQKTESKVPEDQKKELKSPNKEIETNGNKKRTPGKKSIAKGIKVNEESD
jgi:RNA recognition motif-containing protein